jgi:uncharacterized protein
MVLGLLTASCEKKTGLAPTPPAATLDQIHLDQAQPRLPTVKLWLGSQELVAEVARTQTQVATGMMFRKDMGENEGMLFVFNQPHRAAFYMRNTLIPLSCAYIDSEGVILEIHDLTPMDETPRTAGSDNIRYVLETRQGWFQKNGLTLGTTIRTQRGSLSDTFFRSSGG